jgi:phospholipase/carboxylesterase
MNEYLPAIEIEHGSNPQFAVIWLHGLGADGSDFVPVVPALGLAESPGVRFVFPHAPVMPVTPCDSSMFIARGGRIPAPMNSLRN